MKNNSYKKLHPMDRFARNYYCKRARRFQIDLDKEILRKKVRKEKKEQIQDYEEE